MVHLARRFPAAIASYVECRVDPADDRADLLLCVADTTTLRPMSSSDLDETALAAWELVDAVQKARRTPGNPLHANSPLVWLEFDDAPRWLASPAPSVCVCLEPDYLQRHRMLSPNAACEGIAVSTAKLAALDPASCNTLLRCLRTLPATGRAIHLSFMRGRPGSVTKLYLRLSPTDVMPWLKRAGWSGDHRDVLHELLLWRQHDDPFVFVDLSIRDGQVLDRIALAFPRADDGKPFREEILRGLIERFLPESPASAVIAAAQAWTIPPKTLIRRRGHHPQTIHRWIDQKIVLEPSNSELKLYLALRPLPTPLGVLGATGGC